MKIPQMYFLGALVGALAGAAFFGVVGAIVGALAGVFIWSVIEAAGW